MGPNEDAELRRVLREWQVADAPASLEARVMKGRARSAQFWRAAMALAAAAALAAVFLARTPARDAKPVAPVVAVNDEAPFVPVPYVPPLDSYETGRVLRMNVSVAALLAAGYRLAVVDPAAVVEADVLVGDDGRAHAVRLVSGLSLEQGGD